MANYNLVIDSQFQPFSYQEMLHPVQTATQAHQQIEEAYANISTEAAQWEKLANEAGSEQAYQTYKNYANNLQQQADTLAREGLTPLSRQGLSRARTSYIEQIQPIREAYDRRSQIRDLQMQGRMQDGSILYEKEAHELGLDNLMTDPMYTPRSFSGNQIYQKATQVASNLQRAIREDLDQDKWKSILGEQYYELKYGTGLTPNQIMATLERTSEGSKVLRTMLDDVVSSTGIPTWRNQEALDQAYEYANMGAWAAIGQEDRKQVSNKAYDYAMQQQMEIAREIREAERQATADIEKADLDFLSKLNWYERNRDNEYNRNNIEEIKKINEDQVEAYYNTIGNPTAFNEFIRNEEEKELEKLKNADRLFSQDSPDLRKPSGMGPHADRTAYRNSQNNIAQKVNKYREQAKRIVNDKLTNGEYTSEGFFKFPDKSIAALSDMGIDLSQPFNMDDINLAIDNTVQPFTYGQLSITNPGLALNTMIGSLDGDTKFYTTDNKGNITKEIKLKKIAGINLPDGKNEDFSVDDSSVDFFMPDPRVEGGTNHVGMRIHNQEVYIPIEHLSLDLQQQINLYNSMVLPTLLDNTYPNRGEAVKDLQQAILNTIYLKSVGYNQTPGGTGSNK